MKKKSKCELCGKKETYDYNLLLKTYEELCSNKYIIIDNDFKMIQYIGLCNKCDKIPNNKTLMENKINRRFNWMERIIIRGILKLIKRRLE